MDHYKEQREEENRSRTNEETLQELWKSIEEDEEKGINKGLDPSQNNASLRLVEELMWLAVIIFWWTIVVVWFSW